ncbi:MAG: histidine phosphotransferase family protein [Pseudotabrizicola sp.]|uniref:histidine phosphotransferase family protein n=1 Tax=Pseudotabrizicola sp. TaxID=2939647 RepID=UPI002719317C|nr:histidine phosphotransferase family protein [Pseudotabrizicola sp.]MDO8884939.1 histidine phosphotransferase family protein [Pseudotabrizicola sp.]MDP2081372.1 histidine phosphotransferase family protein [Pseudotabrizicola sp.]MDZ7575257.1 histidine phosphotransferase family protein [Pseudotabrizicola sp.]
MTDKPDLTALLGSRICHDLISPIGAIGNGVELLMMDGIGSSPELALIVDSVANANARIRFFRVAFGAAGASDHRIGRAEVAGILSDLTRGGRLTMDWQSPTDLSRREVKLAFLAILCLESAMPHGGTLSIERGDTRWTLRGETARLRVDPDLWELLSNPAATVDLGPAQVHFPLLRDEINRQHRRLTVELGNAAVRLSY